MQPPPTWIAGAPGEQGPQGAPGIDAIDAYDVAPIHGMEMYAFSGAATAGGTGVTWLSNDSTAASFDQSAIVMTRDGSLNRLCVQQTGAARVTVWVAGVYDPVPTRTPYTTQGADVLLRAGDGDLPAYPLFAGDRVGVSVEMSGSTAGGVIHACIAV